MCYNLCTRQENARFTSNMLMQSAYWEQFGWHSPCSSIRPAIALIYTYPRHIALTIIEVIRNRSISRDKERRL